MRDIFCILNEGVSIGVLEKLTFLKNGSHVNRFHVYDMLKPNSVGHHSHGVAMFTLLLADGLPSIQVIIAALGHDMAEQYSGDMPSPAKREMGEEFKSHWKTMEHKILTMFNCAVSLNEEEKKLLHMADLFEALLNCIHERMLGNRYVEQPFSRMLRYVVADCDLNPKQKVILRTLEMMMENVRHG